MILILTNSSDATADYLIPKLEESGLRCLRLDTDTLLSTAAISYQNLKPRLLIEGFEYSPHDFTHVWYRRPEKLAGLDHLPEEERLFAINEWSETIEGFLSHINRERWMNHPSINAGASSKIQQLSTASAVGLKIPATLVTQSEREVRNFAGDYDGKIICKPLSAGMIERSDGSDSLIYTNIVKPEQLANLDDLQTCPTLFQEAVNKTSDLRINAIDGRLHATELLAMDDFGEQRCDIRRNNMADVSYRQVILPEQIAAKLLEFVRHYQLRFAAIDMAVDTNGSYTFFEVNPNGQWAWLDLAAGMNLAELFVEAFHRE